MTKIEKTPLKERVQREIIEHFRREKLTEGEKIPSENELSKLLGVSRVVVREALELLRKSNVIVTYRGKGSFIANPENFKSKISTNLSFEDFSDIMRFRFAIECEAIHEAVEKRTKKDLKGIIAFAEKMELATDIHSFCEADFAFHLEIVRLSGNELFISAIENAKAEIMACFYLMNSLPESKSWAISLHKRFAEFIADKNAALSIKMLKNNGEYNFARMKNLFLGEAYENN